MKNSPLIALALAFTPFAPPMAGAQELAPTQIENILKKLDEIQTKLKRGKEGNNARLMAAISQALGDPKAAVDLYQNCVRTEVFERDERSVTDFNQWKSGLSGLHRSKAFAAALHCHLLFLKAGVQTGEVEDLGEALPAVNAYIEYYLKAEPMLSHPEETDKELEGGRERGEFFNFRNEDVFSGPIGKFFDVPSSAAPVSGWPKTMTDVNGVYDQVLNPYYRAEGMAEALIAGWDKRISALKFRADAREADDHHAAAADMRQKELPKLLWGRSKDLFLHGNQALGASEMLKVIETYLETEEAEKWIAEFAQLLKGDTEKEAAPEREEPGEVGGGEGNTIGEILQIN